MYDVLVFVVALTFRTLYDPAAVPQAGHASGALSVFGLGGEARMKNVAAPM